MNVSTNIHIQAALLCARYHVKQIIQFNPHNCLLRYISVLVKFPSKQSLRQGITQ